MLPVLGQPLGGGSCLGHFWSRTSQEANMCQQRLRGVAMGCLDASPSLLVTFRPRYSAFSTKLSRGRMGCVMCLEHPGPGGPTSPSALRDKSCLSGRQSPAVSKSQSWHKSHALAPLAALNPLVKAIGQRSLAKARNAKCLRDDTGSPLAIEVGDVAILSGSRRRPRQAGIASRQVTSSHRPQKSPDCSLAFLPGTIRYNKSCDELFVSFGGGRRRRCLKRLTMYRTESIALL